MSFHFVIAVAAAVVVVVFVIVGYFFCRTKVNRVSTLTNEPMWNSVWVKVKVHTWTFVIVSPLLRFVVLRCSHLHAVRVCS